MTKLLENALVLADELNDGGTGYLIERALDEARARQLPRPALQLKREWSLWSRLRPNQLQLLQISNT